MAHISHYLKELMDELKKEAATCEGDGKPIAPRAAFNRSLAGDGKGVICQDSQSIVLLAVD